METQNKTPLELVIASTNMHKVREFRAILKSLSFIDVLSLCDFPSYSPPEETGKSFEENAILKAASAAKTLNRLVLADDSGLVVPALNGAPGVYSARFAGLHASDLDNRKKLLEDMAHLEGDDRCAYFECSLALSAPNALLKVTKGTSEGLIELQEKGGGGFGYDPLFIKHGYNKTFAQLGELTKNRISHRRKALDKMVVLLENMATATS